MKQFLLASILRTRLPLAALALGFALWASPARAITIYGGDITIGAGDTEYIGFSCTEDEVANADGTAKRRAVRMDSNPTGHVTFFRELADGTLTQARTIDMFETVGNSSLPVYEGQFVIRGVSPGTTTVTLSISGNEASIQVTVTEPTNITFRDGAGNPAMVFYVPESDQESGHLTLDFGYNLPNNVTFDITSSDAQNIAFTTPLVAYRPSQTAVFNFTPRNGPASALLTFTGDTAYENGATVTVNITNVPPVLVSPASTEERPSAREGLQGASLTFSAVARDVLADTLTFHWLVNGGEVATTVGVRQPGGAASSSVDLPVDGDETIVAVYVDDGHDASRYGYWVVTLAESSKILFTDECTLSTIVAAGGNGMADFIINPATTGTDDATKPWNEATGNNFKAENNTMVQPILAPGTYPFGWWFPDGPDSYLASSPSDLFIPNPNTKAILINTPKGGSEGTAATIRYFSSNPYKDFWNEITGARIDAGWEDPDLGKWVGGFGDFDQDGLSDEWEAWYLDGGKDNQAHSFQEWQTLAVTVGKGQFGSFGTMWRGGTFYSPKDDNNGVAEGSMTTVDYDRIPTARYEEIDNVWTADPHFYEDGDNKVRAFVYPLTGNYIDYGTYVGDDVEFPLASVTGRAYDVLASKRDGESKPYFSNIMEFRGIPQTSSEISEDMENAPNWVMYGYPGILSRTNLAVRGNCPGTDPTVADTDGDGMEDGWEYYFWTTILYENKPEFWRAYDPTFTLYPNLSPGGSADFRSAGIPLLRQALEGYEAEWDGGLFVRYAPQTFEPELIRDECYYGSPNLDPTTRSNKPNYLTNAPIASVAYYEDELAEEPTPAVVFTMGGLEVYTRDGHVDALGRAKLFFDPRQFPDYFDADGNPHIAYAGQEGTYPSTIGADAEPGEIPGAYVDFLTGQFFLPGYDAFPSYIQEAIGSRDATLTASYRTMNGLFPKAWLLNQFDPNGALSPNIADPNFGEILGVLGLSAQMWNPANDLDGDGISDADEFYLGTNPLHWDTDNDGMPDGWEVLFDLDPHDPADATKNPDCDVMFAAGPYRHVDAYLYCYFRDAFWNGAVALAFIPGAGAHAAPDGYNYNIPFTSREEFYVQKWMIGKDDSGNFPMFTQLVYPAQWVDADGNMVKSCNPRSDDSNADHIPDGWALYAGYKPAGSIDLIDHTFAALFPPLPFCPDALRPDPDDKAGDGLSWRAEFENWTMYNTRQGQVGNAYLESEQCVGHYHDAEWYKPTAEDWTNKLYPTDPWHGDTDGDCVSDAAEHSGVDNNGDGSTLVNLNPCSADTRLDRLGDCWHYQTGTYDTTNAAGAGKLGEFGPYGDPDGDGLPNYQEYLAGSVYGWRYDYWYSPDHEELWVPFGDYQGFYSMSDNYLPGRIASDPYIAANYSVDPIPGANLRLYDVIDFMDPPVPVSTDAYPYGKSVHFQPYRPSDFFRARPSDFRVNEIIKTVVRLENRWQRHLTHTFKLDGSVVDAEGWDESNSPTLNDLAKAEEDPQFKVSVIANYMQRIFALTHDVEGRFQLDMDPETGAELPTAFISIEEFYTLWDGTPCAENDLRDYMYSYGRAPAGWEPDEIQVVDPGPPVLWRFMTPKANGFPACMPRDPDTDNDGMDDYWEVYHALNPLYGGSPSVGGAGSYPDQDRADVHAWGNGSTRDWIIEANPAYVRILDPTDAGLQPVPREDAPFHTPMGFPVAAAAHFDYKTRPWLSGDRFADPDQDGLSNQEESYNFLLNDVLHHTDPSPYWFTDPSYAESHVNLYYQLDGEMASTYWWWDLDLLETDADGPSYLFDFEIGEGFDTDNDNISDRVELTQDGNNGVTDPLDMDSPRKRKALYFDGFAAARTRNPYYHDKFTLTSYTVEFWVRPQELPATGKRATLVQRPVLMPVDDSSGATHWRIRNTFLIQIDHLGRICAQVDNDALETVSSATTVSAGRLVPNHWAHVAVVMDSVEDRLTIYINGEYAAGVGAGLKPCTGGLFGFQWQSPTGIQNMWETANLYDYSPAPIVLGAYDRNPWGIVGGAYETFPWGTAVGRTIAGQSEPDFDPDQFFVGWMDEVRIWDRCRDQTDIKNRMMDRFTKDDIDRINHERLRWELENWDLQDSETDRVGTNLVAATTQSEWPQKLLYHYSFDNLPDVMAANDPAHPERNRDTSFMEFFTADADPFPAGWQSETVSAYRPNPFWTAPMWYHYRSLVFPHLVPWWYTAQHRSNIYTDYSYIPWIENTVAHMPQTPALDMKGVFPNWDTTDWTVSSYRYRSTFDWLNDALGPLDFVPARQDDIVPAALPASGSADVTLDRIRNSMNPYVMFYRTAASIVYETAPNQFAGKLDRYGRYTGIPVLSDMLPLMDAVADIDVEMWDGKGRGTELNAVDTDGDGLPDWWEIAHGLDPTNKYGLDGAYGDNDNDGLDNWAEYLAGTDPFRYDTDSDGYSDYYSRPDNRSLTYGELYDDGDGMDNVWEEEHGLDPNRNDGNDDFDNDGWTNWEEYMAHVAFMDFQKKPDSYERPLSDADPTDAAVFPEPWFNVEFHYSGEQINNAEGVAASTRVLTYGEKSAGPHMGGFFDGQYNPERTQMNPPGKTGSFQISVGKAIRTFDKKTTLDGFPVGDGATIDADVNGAPRICIVAPYNLDPNYGLVVEVQNPPVLALLHYSTGVIYSEGAFSVTRARYALSGRSFPYTARGMNRMPGDGIHDHMVSGWNRFLGYLDLDGNDEWSLGEPMGLSQPKPMLVSWDTVETTIPLSDSVWGYPRIQWGSGSSTNGVFSSGLTYFVNFTWVHGASTGEESETIGGGSSYYSTTGDLDKDGLEDWMEALAGTDPGTPAGGTNDYYRIDPATGFSYGELYDDGDGMPTPWEVKFGLDPYRNDGGDDKDDDGWSNYAEFMAGTDPTSASDYPQPRFSATFYYHGEQSDLANLGVYTYSQKTQGATWGGAYDGRYTSTKGFLVDVVLGSDGTVTLDEYSNAGASGTFAVNKLEHGLVESSSIDVYVQSADGAIETRSFTMSQINPGMGLYTQDEMGAILISLESGQVLSTGDYVGKAANVSTIVRTYTFPVTFTGLVRNPEGNHTHMVEGPNRFLGWMDLDGNETYDQGEPMGLGLYNPTLVGWDSTSVEIPLTDSLWDYPRISWNGATNETAGVGTVCYYVDFSWVRGASTGSSTETIGGGASYYPTTDDWDSDGLEDWMELLAGTPTNTPAGGANDYYSKDPVSGYTWGELYDDGDGMPTKWELKYGLNPYRDDARGDVDDDGWSNYAEFMAGTDPTDPNAYPKPQFDVTFYYNGDVNGASTLKVQTYSELVNGTATDAAGATTVRLGGRYDSIYTTQGKGMGNFASHGRGEVNGTDFGTSDFGGRHINSATLSVYVDGQKVDYQLQPYNDDFGVFVNDANAFILLEYATGLVYSQFNYQTKRSRNEANADGTATSISEDVWVKSYDSSEMYQSRYEIEYSSSTTHYPFALAGLQPANIGDGDTLSPVHDHMLEGYNRFLGLMDLNGNNTWDEGEPMGLSPYGGTLVDWSSVTTEIPLRDSIWDFPRVSWNDMVPTNAVFTPTHYVVTFKYVGKETSSDGGSTTNESSVVIGGYTPVYGDNDGDGLDSWQESKAGSDPNNAFSLVRPSKARLDYDFTNKWSNGFTLGERYDDGDMMPAQWEMINNIDPDRFDADTDTDGDGWTNYEEYRGRTWAGVARSFPMPVMEIKYLYDGEIVTNTTLTAQTYSERKQGTFLDGTDAATIYMGGWYDGRYTTMSPYNSVPHAGEDGGTAYLAPSSGFIVCDGIFGEDGVQTVQNIEFAVSYVPQAQISTFRSTGPLSRSSSVGIEIFSLSNGMTVARGLLGPAITSGRPQASALTALNEEVGMFALDTYFGFTVDTPTNRPPQMTEMGTTYYKPPLSTDLDPEPYYIITEGEFLGQYYGRDSISGVWGIGSYEWKPFPEGSPNYYEELAFFRYETGAILTWGLLAEGTYGYRITSYQTDGFVFPVTVGAWYRDDGTPNPVSSWFQSDNGAHTHAVGGYNRILGFSDVNQNGQWDMGEPMGLSLYDAVLIGPDSFKTTIPLTDELFGFPRISWPASTNENVTSYKVEFWTGTGELAGRLRVEAPRTFLHEGDWMEAAKKANNGKYGMDLGSTESGLFEYYVWADNGSEEELLKEGTFVVSVKPNYGNRRALEPISPVNRSKVCGSLVELAWKMDWRTEGVFVTIKSGTTGKAVEGLDNLYVPFPVRHGKVTDDDYYYTCIPQLQNGRKLIHLPSGTYFYTITENIRNTTVTPKSFTDKFVMENETDGSRARAAIKGHIHYYGRQAFANIPGVNKSAGTSKVKVQAYEVSNRARTSLSVGGNPVAFSYVSEDGSFELHGLEAGTYGVIAWADLDENGLLEDTETMGYGFLGGSASPIQVPERCVPLVITNSPDYAAVNLEDVHVVLRDRDTDSDGVPNALGFPTDDNITTRKNNLKAMPLHVFPSSIPAGCNWISQSLFSTNKIERIGSQVVIENDPTISIDYVTKDFVVKAPRTFLHEGDFAAGGLLGFNLGDTNSIDVTWSVLATDGRHAETLGGDMFTVWAPYRTGADLSTEWAVTNAASINYRDPLKARWPTQMTKVYESPVTFEWTMDSHNAGVLFSIRSLDNGSVNTNFTIPFPIMHWDPLAKCYYFTAVPQKMDGFRFLDLPDGTYEYTITERTRSTMIPPQSVTERFQVAKSQPSRMTGSVSGDIWYYGRSTVNPTADPSRWADDLHLQAYKVSDSAGTSAAVGSQLVADSVRKENGAFTISGLEAGTYSIFAFVDSNGNGLADDWETQGFGVFGGNASPVVIPATAPAIIVTNGAAVTGVNLVLHDRDTDGDLLPDVWEWDKYGSLTLHNGYEAGPSNAYVRLPVPPATVLTNWTWKIDRSQIVTRIVDIPESDSLLVRIDAPRTFLHEGDLLSPYTLKDRSADAKDVESNREYHLWKPGEENGAQVWVPQTVPYYGFYLGSYSNAVVNWKATAWDGHESTPVSEGSFRVTAAIGAERKPVVARWPVQKTVVHGSVVEFQWLMDEHSSGAVFSLWKLSGPEEGAAREPIVENRVIPLPVMHWDQQVKCYYYTAKPQMDDGLRFLELEDGFYEYSITERPQTDLVDPQTITERFQLRNAENTRVTGSIEGDVWYFGRSTVPGTNPPEWASDLHIQAYKVSDAATSSTSVGGELVAETVQKTNGAFLLGGIQAGTYSVFAFVDSNGNGIADDWETQGFGFYGGNASPVVIPASATPIVVTNGASVVGINVVLHDRDTDGDLLPDVWEWESYGNLSSQTGYDAAASNAYTSLTLPDPSFLTNWIWKVDRSTVITRTVEIPISDSIRVRIDGPRTFLHEGDLMMPYVYKQRLSGIRALGVTGLDDPETDYDTQMNDAVNRSDYLFDTKNREYYLWLKDQDSGEWKPLDSPVYGFDLGTSSNAIVKWTVEAWDGADTISVTNGAFHVISTVGDLRKHVAARYPTQGTKLYGNLVEFEWEMDDHNAGVLFDLWKIGNRTKEGGRVSPFPVTNEITGAVVWTNRLPVMEGKVIALPVRHGRPGLDGGYFSAVPQLDDGAIYDRVLRKYEWTPDNGKTFVELPGDGWYEYRITERPRMNAVEQKSVVEQFQLANDDDANRGLYDASGNIRYYGKVMEREIIAPLGTTDGSSKSYSANVEGKLPAGSMAVLLVRGTNGTETADNWYDTAESGTWAEEVFNDSAANGILYASSTLNSSAWSGTIDYKTGDIEILFDDPPEAGLEIVLVRKTFPAPLVLQAYKLAPDAKTCVSVSGTPVYQEYRNTKGEFTIPNLKEGNYAILAFLDSNGNGYADFWETQGYAEKTATVSPNIDAASAPIHVGGNDSNVTGLMLVLHDRDTDNDLIPDAWEWWKTAEDPQGSRLTRSGYEQNDPAGLMWYQEYADGVLDSDPRTPDTDLDGLTDAMEILVTGTDTHLRDTDGDGVGDLEEFLSGSDPLDSGDAVPYTVPALAFDENGVPLVDIAYPAINPGVVLTYELQRKVALDADEWETVAEHEVANTGNEVLYGQYDGVNLNMSAPGTARMLPADQAEGVDFTTGFYRIKVFADYGRMVDNGDGTWSYWTWVKTGSGIFTYKEAARGAGKLVRDSAGNWSFVSDATGRKGVLVRDEDGNWSFQN